MAEYNRFIWKMKDLLTQKLKESGQYDLYRTLELPLMMVLSDMEFAGFRVDPGWLESFKALLEQEIARLQKDIDARAATPSTSTPPNSSAPFCLKK